MKYNIAEIMLFNTCNYSCGYCGFATYGTARDKSDMDPFKEKGYIDNVVDFFNRHSGAEQKWVLHLSGGEPLIMPNLNYFCRSVIEAGHKIALNTNLSIPIEKNGWCESVPPVAVDCIIASLHKQSLDNFGVIYNRVKTLKERGYPICIRMVAHPVFLGKFEELENEFKKIDVSFSVNPLYSPNYPKAYTENEKIRIMKYMKVNYEVIRLNGGLDMTGRKCRAGSKLICVALGRSGGGKLYPCASTSTQDMCMGDIFGDVNFINELTPCLREDKVCSCAIHFIHNVIPSVDDYPAHKKMVNGYCKGIEDSWEDWFSKKDIKTKFHKSMPQGTQEGENVLVIGADSHDREASKKQTLKEKKMSEIAIPGFGNWDTNRSLFESIEIERKNIKACTNILKYEILSISPPLSLPLGVYRLYYELSLHKGGLTLGVLSADKSNWLNIENLKENAIGYIKYIVKKRNQKIRIALAACNHYTNEIVDFDLTQIRLYKVSGSIGVFQENISQFICTFRSQWRLVYKPNLNLKKIDWMVGKGRLFSYLKQKAHLENAFNAYQLVDSVEAGYAVRSIVSIRTDAKTKYLVSADVGDDSMSIIPMKSGRMKQGHKIKFPNRSAPIHLGVLKTDNEKEGLVACFFNFDISGKETSDTSLVLMKDFGNNGSIPIINKDISELDIVHSRNGFWGYRGVHILQDKHDFKIAAVDRHKGRFILVTGNVYAKKTVTQIEEVDIGIDTEPIGLNAVRRSDVNLDADYYITSRNLEEIVVVGYNEQGELKVKQRQSIRGKSRSSVAVGAFREKHKKEIAVAIWGGDPTHLNEFGIGEFVVGERDKNGHISNVRYQKAGVHPTDIAAGDLDGDGLDEIIVLNYGVGLGPSDRTHPGSVQIFKFKKNKFECVAKINIPNPRIALVTDIDDDGKMEVVVSMFFEKKLVLIKYI